MSRCRQARRRNFPRLAALVLAGLLAACATPGAPPPAPSEPDRLVLSAVDYSRVPGWTADNYEEA